MNLRAASIPITMLVSFGVAMAVLMPRDGRRNVFDPPPIQQPKYQANLASRNRLTARSEAPESPHDLARPVTAAATRAMPASVELLPNPVGHAGDLKAVVSNESGAPLALEVTAENHTTRGHAAVHVTLEPHGQASLTKLGLAIAPGDHVTLHGSPYPDLTVTIADVEE